MSRKSRKILTHALAITVIPGVVLGGSPVYAGGLLGDAINVVAPGVGTAIDNVNRQVKENVPVYKQVEGQGSAVARQTGATVQKAGTDIITTTVKAGNDTITTAVKAGKDTVTTVQKAGRDAAATYQKGWKDTIEQSQRNFKDAVDAGDAVARFTRNQLNDELKAVNKAAVRVREGKVIDAIWGAAVEPSQAAEKNFVKAAQESVVIHAATQTAAAAYGGPAGAAAYSAWYTYRVTGDANLALKAGVLSAVTSAAGGSIEKMPYGTATELLKKAAVTGAVGGMAVAAAGGDERAVKDAFLKSGSAVLVQGGSDRLKAYSPKAQNAIEAAQCLSAHNVDCLSNTTYARDAKGKLLYDKNGKPRIVKLDPKQNVGQWTSIDSNSVEGKTNRIVTGISKLPQTQSIPIANNQWVVTWTFGKTKILPNNVPTVVLTYMGEKPPFYSTVHYGNASKLVSR